MKGRLISSCGLMLAICSCILTLGIKGAGTLPTAVEMQVGPSRASTTGPLEAVEDGRDVDNERRQRIKALMDRKEKIQKLLEMKDLAGNRHDPVIDMAERAMDKIKAEILEEGKAKDMLAQQPAPYGARSSGQLKLSAENFAGIRTLREAVDIVKQQLIREGKPNTQPLSPSTECGRRCRPRSEPMRLT